MWRGSDGGVCECIRFKLYGEVCRKQSLKIKTVSDIIY